MSVRRNKARNKIVLKWNRMRTTFIVFFEFWALFIYLFRLPLSTACSMVKHCQWKPFVVRYNRLVSFSFPTRSVTQNIISNGPYLLDSVLLFFLFPCRVCMSLLFVSILANNHCHIYVCKLWYISKIQLWYWYIFDRMVEMYHYYWEDGGKKEEEKEKKYETISLYHTW